jgi:hypothetical protein
VSSQREHLAANLVAARQHLDRALIEVNKGLTRLEGASPEDDGMNCYECGLPFRSSRKLAEHVYVTHDGPVPAHYEEQPDDA